MSVPRVKLNDGTSIPAIGFGTGTALFKQECKDLVLSALNNGYTYLDTAQQYGNAASIGDALKEWKGKREDIYILTKFGVDNVEASEFEPRKVLQEQLKLMGVGYVDMYLIHSPLYAKPNFAESWKIMEQLKEEGLTKSIGVSNFREEDLLEMSKTWKIPPAVNQIEFNPYIHHAANIIRLLDLCKKYDIIIQSYGPQNPVNGRSPDGPVNPIVERIAKEKGGLTDSQVLLLWAHQFTGGCIVVTSRNDKRQKEQLEALTAEPLTKEQVEEIAQAGKKRFHRHFQHQVWNPAKP